MQIKALRTGVTLIGDFVHMWFGGVGAIGPEPELRLYEKGRSILVGTRIYSPGPTSTYYLQLNTSSFLGVKTATELRLLRARTMRSRPRREVKGERRGHRKLS